MIGKDKLLKAFGDVAPLVGLLAKSLESMLLLWEQHVEAIPADDDSPEASRLRSTANATRFDGCWAQMLGKKTCDVLKLKKKKKLGE